MRRSSIAGLQAKSKILHLAPFNSRERHPTSGKQANDSLPIGLRNEAIAEAILGSYRHKYRQNIPPYCRCRHRWLKRPRQRMKRKNMFDSIRPMRCSMNCLQVNCFQRWTTDRVILGLPASSTLKLSKCNGVAGVNVCAVKATLVRHLMT